MANNLKQMTDLNLDALKAEQCTRSLYAFIQEFWSIIIPEPPVYNWHIKYLCDELQKITMRVIRRQPKENDLIINIPPGSTKSTICSVMLPVWAWTIDATLRFITGSYSYDLSLDLANKSRDIIKSDKYKRMFPDIVIRTDTDSKSYYKNTQKGDRYSTSAGGSVLGMHAHIIIVDDPINPKEAVSDVKLRAANEWMDRTLSQRKVDKTITPTILIQQRLHEDDPTGHWLAKSKGNLKHICLPAELSEDVKPVELKKYYSNGMLDPIRLNQNAIKEAHKDLGSYGYAGQYEQRPAPLEGGMFSQDYFRLVKDFDASQIADSCRFWDKAGTEGGGARTAGVRMVRMKDKSFGVISVKKGHWSAGRREKIILSTAKVDGRRTNVWVEQEPGSGGKESAENTIQNLAGYKIKAEKPTGSKTARAEPYAVQCEGGNVWILIREWTQEFIDEHTVFPNGKYKDQVDSAAGAFNKLNNGNKRAGAMK